MSEVAAYQRHRPGIYRRRILIQGGDGWVRADMEDDPHRYGVLLHHRDGIVTTAEAFPLRTPWDLCTVAAAQLSALVGMRLSPDPTAIFRHTAASRQCTHVFDTAGLAVAHAARGTLRREYEIEAPYWSPQGPRELVLWRDGVEVLRWTVDGGAITSPEPYAGQGWQKMLRWARDAFVHRDDFEAIVVLRRATMISGARTVSLDALDNAAQTGHINGACHVFQPEVAPHARRIPGSTLDFTDAAAKLLQDLDPSPGHSPREARHPRTAA
ncbi:MAG: DUF2889 domain-containing protein [Solimonas sp.]